MKKIILFIPLIIIIFLTVGFSALERDLLVDNIGLVVRPTKIIRVTDAVNSEITNGAQSLSYDYNVDNINGTIKLPQNNSTISYSVTITNIGTQEVGILDMTLSNNNLDYEINGVKKIERICNTNNACSGGIFRTYTVKIKYKSGVTATNNNIDFIATFNFKNYYTITYSGFDSVSGLETGILEGDTKTITFNTTTGNPSNVTVTGASGIYTYQATTNPDTSTLSLSNVTGNVTITAMAGTVEVIENPDGTTTTVIENTVTNNDGTETTTTVTVNQDANGNTTSSSQETTTTSTSGGVTTTESTVVNYDANGNQTSATETTTTESSSGSTVTTVNYDANNDPTTGSTATTDTSGNVNTQETTYDSNGDPVVTGYNIDTSANNTGESISNGLETGVLVFDGHDWTATLKASILFSDITPSGKQFPIFNISSRDENNKLNGAFFLVSRATSGLGSNVYDENGTKQSTTTSSNPTLKWRIQQYEDGTLTTGKDFYHQSNYNSYKFGSKTGYVASGTSTTPITLVYKMSFNASTKALTTEIYKSDGTTIVAKPQGQYTFSFPNQLADVDFEIGQAVNVSGTTLKTKMTIISFEIEKTL